MASVKWSKQVGSIGLAVWRERMRMIGCSMFKILVWKVEWVNQGQDEVLRKALKKGGVRGDWTKNKGQPK